MCFLDIIFFTHFFKRNSRAILAAGSMMQTHQDFDVALSKYKVAAQVVMMMMMMIEMLMITLRPSLSPRLSGTTLGCASSVSFCILFIKYLSIHFWLSKEPKKCKCLCVCVAHYALELF